MRTYRIVEDRGCGIVYTRFTGSLKDCKKWLRDNCWYNEHTNNYYSLGYYVHLLADTPEILKDNGLISSILSYIHGIILNDPENVNGNNEPFTYHIEVDDE
jgi:hypothetical protein